MSAAIVRMNPAEAARAPDGATKTLLSIDDWDFAWQDRYYFRDLVPLPAGTRTRSRTNPDSLGT
jgi:hypothetical protein